MDYVRTYGGVSQSMGKKDLRKVYDLKGTEMDGEFVQTSNYKINMEVLI
jgi:hypothetical protein